MPVLFTFINMSSANAWKTYYTELDNNYLEPMQKIINTLRNKIGTDVKLSQGDIKRIFSIKKLMQDSNFDVGEKRVDIDQDGNKSKNKEDAMVDRHTYQVGKFKVTQETKATTNTTATYTPAKKHYVKGDYDVTSNLRKDGDPVMKKAKSNMVDLRYLQSKDPCYTYVNPDDSDDNDEVIEEYTDMVHTDDIVTEINTDGPVTIIGRDDIRDDIRDNISIGEPYINEDYTFYSPLYDPISVPRFESNCICVY